MILLTENQFFCSSAGSDLQAIRHLYIFPTFLSQIVKTDPKLPSRPTTKSGNRKGNQKTQIQNNSKQPTVSILNSKVDGIDGKQECLEKFLLEHVCGINCFIPYFRLLVFGNLVNLVA